MELKDIFSKLEGVFEDVFGEPVALSEQLTADDVAGWDSLTHVQLLISVEKAFGVKFSSSEISNLPNVGSLVDLVRKHLIKSAA